MSYYLPTFLPQNPLYSGDKYGWQDCTAFAAACMADFDSQGKVRLSGAQVRRESNEPIPNSSSPGLSLWQVRDVLAKHGVTMTPYAGASFEWACSMRDAGHAVIWCVGYGPIRHTVYSGDWGFSGNHAIGGLPTGQTDDPLTDGRPKPYVAGGGHYPQGFQRIPDSLLREACGQLYINSEIGYLGAGRCYVGIFSRAYPPMVMSQQTGVGTDVAIRYMTRANTGRVKHLPQGTAIYDRPGGRVVTHMKYEADVPYLGWAGPVPQGWQSVQVGTSYSYPDHKLYLTGLYVRAEAGPVRNA